MLVFHFQFENKHLKVVSPLNMTSPKWRGLWRHACKQPRYQESARVLRMGMTVNVEQPICCDPGRGGTLVRRGVREIIYERSSLLFQSSWMTSFQLFTQ
jgi:hypothetical protein